MATGTVTSEREKPTPEHYAGGRRRVKKANPNDSPAPPPTNGRICYVCKEPIASGAGLSVSQDFQGQGRTLHASSRDGAGKVIFDCADVFDGQRKAAAMNAQEEHNNDLLLEAAERKYGEKPPPVVAAVVQNAEQSRSMARAPIPRREIFDCPIQTCDRFYDKAKGRDLHIRREHKVSGATAS